MKKLFPTGTAFLIRPILKWVRICNGWYSAAVVAPIFFGPGACTLGIWGHIIVCVVQKTLVAVFSISSIVSSVGRGIEEHHDRISNQKCSFSPPHRLLINIHSLSSRYAYLLPPKNYPCLFCHMTTLPACMIYKKKSEQLGIPVSDQVCHPTMTTLRNQQTAPWVRRSRLIRVTLRAMPSILHTTFQLEAK